MALPTIGMLATSFIFTPKGSSVFSSAICDSSNNDKSTAEESDKEERKNKSRGIGNSVRLNICNLLALLSDVRGHRDVVSFPGRIRAVPKTNISQPFLLL